MKIIPIDIAKFHHCVSVIDDCTGEVLIKPFYFNNDIQGFLDFFKIIKPFIRQKHIIGLESTGHYGDNLIHFLLEHNCSVGLINPLATKAESKKKIRKTKNDKIDTQIIYRVICSGDYTPITKNSMVLREAKFLTRCYCSKSEELNIYKNKLQKYIDLVFPEINSYFSTKYSKVYMAVLKEFGSACNLANAHLSRIKKVTHIKGRGKKTKCNPKELREIARHSIGEDSDIIVLEIQSLIQIIEIIESQIQNYKTKIEELAKELNSPIFSIPGIGFVTGLAILSEIKDINQFSSHKKLIAFAGADPSVYDSGEYSAEHCSISKRGSRYLRKALYQAALPVCHFNSTFNIYYSLKRSQGKSHRCAQGHVVRKLLRVIYKLCTKDILFKAELLK